MTSEWVIASASVVNAVVIIVLAIVTKHYADETKRIADTAKEQTAATERMAEATRSIADATLRPAIFHWIAGQQVPEPGEKTVSVKYRNVGSGPAANVRWSLDPGGAGEITETPRRVFVDVREDGDLRTKLKFPLPDGSMFVVARYGDIFGTEWESRLRLFVENGALQNGESTLQRVSSG